MQVYIKSCTYDKLHYMLNYIKCIMEGGSDLGHNMFMLELVSGIELEIMKILWDLSGKQSATSIMNELEKREISISYPEEDIEDRDRYIKEQVSRAIGNLVEKKFIKVNTDELGFKYEAGVQSHIYYCFAITTFAKSLFNSYNDKKDIDYVHKLGKQCKAIEDMYYTIEE